MHNPIKTAALLFLCLGSALGDLGCNASVANEEISFAHEIRPLLAENCFHCHGPDANTREADLRLDDSTAIAAVIIPGDAAASGLIERLLTDDPELKMPPPDSHRQLSVADIEKLTRWIDQGAAWGEHWSVAPLRLPNVAAEKVADRAESVRSRLDHYVWARMGEIPQLSPSPLADRRTLIRRLTLDLTGLPPTPEEVASFVCDDHPAAIERLIDRLLASPEFGQRMAWDWLDAARYADTNGYQGDGERTMWPWRDWVVRALNSSLAFDLFSQWQLAGDLLPDATPESRLATGFLRNHAINGEGGRIAEENRVDYVMDMTETVGTVWLAATFNCCRCHDHKFDPLTQRDYYQLSAYFNQTPVDGSGGNPQTPPTIPWPTREQAEQEQAWQAELELAKKNGDSDEAKATIKAWEDKLQQLRGAIPRVMVMEDRGERRPTQILNRGLYNQPGEEVGAAVPASLFGSLATGDNSLASAAENVNRLQLVDWMFSAAAPLTSRVAVNRLWQQFFGIGLVKTSEDFGVQSETPIQGDLLDYLAFTYHESNWDTKHLIRTIVGSHTYLQSSASRPLQAELDPENRFLSRGARYRLPAWMLRDQALAVSGLLVREQGGPSVNVYQPGGVWEEATFGTKTYRQDHGASLYRRSLYVFWRRIAAPTMFFDNAARQTCEVKPIRTNTPLHALTTFNDIQFVEAARMLAAQVCRLEGIEREERFNQQLAHVFERVLSRKPTPAEQTILHRAWQRSLTQYGEQPEQAAALLAVGEHPTTGELPVAEHAAWTALCLAVLNFDETLSKE